MDIIELHNNAMDIADDADRAKLSANDTLAKSLYKEAYELESKAACYSLEQGVGEPTTSILFKSAAFMAYDAGLLRESEQLVCRALSLDLCDEIAEELRDLLENINFSRHLRLNGVILSENEFQVVVAGKGVAHGMAKENDVNGRISAIKQLLIRTIERSQGKAFRVKGKPSKDVLSFGETYLSVPRAASFAVTMRLGHIEPSLFGDIPSCPNSIIEDLATNLSLINEGNIPGLKERIKDQSYLSHFFSQAKELAPDGDSVSVVGLTYIKNGQEIPVQFTKSKKEFRSLSEFIFVPSEDGDGTLSLQNETLSGLLSAADSSANTVRIKTIDGKQVNVTVPEGLAEIVRKYFDDYVSILTSHNTSLGTYKLISVDSISDVSLF